MSDDTKGSASEYQGTPVCNSDGAAVQEMLSQRGAMNLAKRLQDYWHVRGFEAVRFWAEPIDERFDKVGSYELYRVVCNLVNGLPPQYAK